MYKGQIYSDIFGQTTIGEYTVNEDHTINFTIDTENHKGTFRNFSSEAFLTFLDCFDYFRSQIITKDFEF